MNANLEHLSPLLECQQDHEIAIGPGAAKTGKQRRGIAVPSSNSSRKPSASGRLLIGSKGSRC